MKPASFAYHLAHSADEALALLAEHGDAKVLAGGQSLIPTMNFRLAQPERLIDLNAAPDMADIAMRGHVLRIGAMTRQRAVEQSPLVARHAPLVTEAMTHVAHPQIRNRGTLGGSLAHADPAAELPAVMCALDARFIVRGPGGERTIPAAEFHVGLFATALAQNELLVAVEIPPAAPRTGSAFEEVARRHGDFALVGVAAMVALDADGACADARVVLLSVGDGPRAAEQAIATLRGVVPSTDVIAAAAQRAGSVDIDPPGDMHASSAYRRQLAQVLTQRALVRAVDRATGNG